MDHDSSPRAPADGDELVAHGPEALSSRAAIRTMPGDFAAARADVGAYIPCCNNAATLSAVIDSVRAQSVAVADLIVIDDASIDSSHEVASSLGVRCIRMERNSGRGAVRALAFQELQSEFILGVDATNTLNPAFVENALPLFEDAKVAFVRGELRDPSPVTLADRWRARHLFQQWRCENGRSPYVTSLATGGTISRRSAVLEVGNFNKKLRHSEDLDLGCRLQTAGFKVLAQPASQLRPLTKNTLAAVLERYWRWYAGIGEPIDLVGYFRSTWYALSVMVRRDIAEGDFACVPISLFVPHYQFWRTVARRIASR